MEEGQPGNPYCATFPATNRNRVNEEFTIDNTNKRINRIRPHYVNLTNNPFTKISFDDGRYLVVCESWWGWGWERWGKRRTLVGE